MHDISNTEAEDIFKAIEDVLRRLNSSWNWIKEQCYDLAISIPGGKSGEATHISQKECRSVFIHCCGCVLNLACSNSVKKYKLSNDTQERGEGLMTHDM